MLDAAAIVRCLTGPTATVRELASSALAGHDCDFALHDALLEAGVPMESPFSVGQRYLICTLTLYYVGEVSEVSFGFLRLKDASWVHWTGRLSALCRHKKFSKLTSGDRRARVEPCGDVVIAISSIVSAYPGEWELPTEPMT